MSPPFIEDFNTALDPNKWWFNDRASITSRANVAEPSEPASMKLNANKGSAGYQVDIRTGVIDMSPISDATLS